MAKVFCYLGNARGIRSVLVLFAEGAQLLTSMTAGNQALNIAFVRLLTVKNALAFSGFDVAGGGCRLFLALLFG